MIDSKIIEILTDIQNEYDKKSEATETRKTYKKSCERSLALGLAIANFEILHLAQKELNELKQVKTN
jgi:hypothetical protein